MQVKIIEECEQAVSPVTKKKFPVGWHGNVDDDLALEMIAMGFAEDPDGVVTRDSLLEELEAQETDADIDGDGNDAEEDGEEKSGTDDESGPESKSDSAAKAASKSTSGGSRRRGSSSKK